ncbi:MAG TPA: hypothetical protein VLW25_16105 [Bryobacteraceae bacterium]|nr:hypothetical protein [Bryobacteraceae bacterium]
MSSSRRLMGLSGASLWLTTAAVAFWIPSLWLIGTRAAWLLLVAGGVIAIVLIAVSIAMIRAVLRLPGAAPPRTPEERALMQRFRWVTVAEVAAWALVSCVCIAIHHVALLVPLDVAILGLHFLPLARIFGNRRYYPLGVLICGVAILTLAIFREDAHIGRAIAWYVVPALGSAPAVWIVAGANLGEVRRLIRDSGSMGAAIY